VRTSGQENRVTLVQREEGFCDEAIVGSAITEIFLAMDFNQSL
jgi:hypothetical protein